MITKVKKTKKKEAEEVNVPAIKPGFYVDTSSWYLYLAVLFMVGVLPVLASWTRNSRDNTASDIIFPAILALILATIVALWFFTEHRKNKLLAYVIGMATVSFFAFRYEIHLGGLAGKISKFFYSEPGTQILFNNLLLGVIFPIAILELGKFIFLFISFRLKGRLKGAKAESLWKSLMVAVCVTFAILFSSFLRLTYVEWPQFSFEPKEINSAAKSGYKPDIYYIVLDRYASQSVLESNYNFSNSDFIGYLKENKFVVDANAHNNYPYTAMSISSTLNADYHSDLVEKFSQEKEQILEPYHDKGRKASVVKELKRLGYSYYHLGSWYGVSNQSSLADHNLQKEGRLSVLGHDFMINEFGQTQLSQSIFSHYFNRGLVVGGFPILNYGERNAVNTTLYKLETLKRLADEKPGGRFIFAHFLIPHDPYVFNADGSLSKYPERNNVEKSIKQKYLDQVKFINSQMKDLYEQIKKRSKGKAVVILLADEGPRPEIQGNHSTTFNFGRDMSKWPEEDLQMKFGNLAAFYVPEAKEEDVAAHGDSVNIFRLILNTYFEAKLKYLPKCYYGYPYGTKKLFVFEDITEKLTGQQNPSCPKDGVFEEE